SFCNALLICVLPPAALTFFFFYYSGDHRDLHSFPTRRSSDLLVLRRVGERVRVQIAVLDDLSTLVEGLRHLRSFIETDKPVAVEDRKSTRLNSSHVKISYAVFCLKKKKK